MDKTEESALLELQELALKHKSSKRQKTLEEKQMIVKAHLLNHVPIPQLCVDFGITRTTIYRWISTFADGNMPVGRSKGTADVKQNPPAMPKKQNVEESTAEKLARLRTENQLWDTDITYIPIWNYDGSYTFCYLSMITDYYTKEIIAWFVGESLDAWCSVECLRVTRGLSTMCSDH